MVSHCNICLTLRISHESAHLLYVLIPIEARTADIVFGIHQSSPNLQTLPPSQALAPALIILYATLLFLFAADLFATKDIFLTED